MVGAGGYGWRHGHHWDRMNTEGDSQAQGPPFPPPMAAETPPEEAALHSSLPTVRFPPVSGYVSIPSHPLGASTSTETYLQTSAWAIFFCASSGSKDIPATF